MSPFCRIYHKNSVNHPKQADLTWPKKKKSQGIILAISCSNKATSVWLGQGVSSRRLSRISVSLHAPNATVSLSIGSSPINVQANGDFFCIFLRKNIYCRQHFGCSPTDYRKKLQQKLHWKGGAAACPLRRLQKHANASFLSVQSVISLFAIVTSLLFRKYYWAQRNPKMECL